VEVEGEEEEVVVGEVEDGVEVGGEVVVGEVEVLGP